MNCVDSLRRAQLRSREPQTQAGCVESQEMFSQGEHMVSLEAICPPLDCCHLAEPASSRRRPSFFSLLKQVPDSWELRSIMTSCSFRLTELGQQKWLERKERPQQAVEDPGGRWRRSQRPEGSVWEGGSKVSAGQIEKRSGGMTDCRRSVFIVMDGGFCFSCKGENEGWNNTGKIILFRFRKVIVVERVSAAGVFIYLLFIINLSVAKIHKVGMFLWNYLNKVNTMTKCTTN